MPGKRITDHQVHKYKQHRNQLSQVAAAAKAGISERSARRIEDAQSLPSQRAWCNWRTRADPLGTVWDSEVIPLLQTDARLNAVTLLEELQRRHPGQWDASVLRTQQRRIRLWRAQSGIEREAFGAPVKLEGFTQRKTQRHEGVGCFASRTTPLPNEGGDPAAAAGVALVFDLNKQCPGCAPVLFGT